MQKQNMSSTRYYYPNDGQVSIYPPRLDRRPASSIFFEKVLSPFLVGIFHLQLPQSKKSFTRVEAVAGFERETEKRNRKEKRNYQQMDKGQSSQSFSGGDGKPVKARILCLHGHNSCNEITEMQVFGLDLHKRAKCDFLHGPHSGKAGDGLSHFSNGPWYTWMDTSADAQDYLEGSLEYLANHIKKNGPYDGVYCFSQSCIVVTLFSDPKIWRDLFGLSDCPWKFVILACAGGPQLLEMSRRRLSGRGIDMPTLHVKGATDQILNQSIWLEQYWEEQKRKTYTHKGGHAIDLSILRREPDLEKLLSSFLKENSPTYSNALL